jgi:hypothetical protein
MSTDLQIVFAVEVQLTDGHFPQETLNKKILNVPRIGMKCRLLQELRNNIHTHYKQL